MSEPTILHLDLPPGSIVTENYLADPPDYESQDMAEVVLPNGRIIQAGCYGSPVPPRYIIDVIEAKPFGEEPDWHEPIAVAYAETPAEAKQTVERLAREHGVGSPIKPIHQARFNALRWLVGATMIDGVPADPTLADSKPGAGPGSPLVALASQTLTPDSARGLVAGAVAGAINRNHETGGNGNGNSDSDSDSTGGPA